MSQAEDENSTTQGSTNVIPISSVKIGTGVTPPARRVQSNVTDQINAQDVLSARLSQIEGMLIVIAGCYDDEEDDFMIAGCHLRNALWALRELRDQADKAYQALADALSESRRALT